MAIKSQQEMYDDFITELENQAPEITDRNEGSNVDILAGVVSTAVSELAQITQDEFRKTFFDTAHGPEVTGGPDDLQTLAVDHFGDGFKRPAAVKSSGIISFSRPNADKGDVLIPVGTIVKTQKTSAGNAVSFEVISQVTMTGLAINASVRAVLAGPSGNVNPNTITVIESSLSDSSVVVTNAQSLSGGKSAENDAEYRLTIKRLLETLKGATIQAIESKAASVAGVVFVKAIETIQYVKEWDIGLDQGVGEYFRIPRAKVYVADANGNASSLLIETVKNAITSVRAAGVRVDVHGAIPVNLNWQAELTLNASGPNHAILSEDLSMIKDEMTKYIQDRAVGESFYRTLANNYILSKFGPAGTNDITSFTTAAPSADVAVAENQKLLVGTVTINGI